MGSEGWKPMLHVGGVHDALTEAPPAAVAEAVPEVVLWEIVPAATETDVGWDDVHVKGAPIMMFPRLSVTVALIVWDDPCVKIIGLLLFPFAERVMDWTGQVMKSNGTLTTLPRVANVVLTPGTPAVACTWL